MRSTGVRLVTRPTGRTVPTRAPYGDAVDPLPAYTAVVLAGGRAARLGGQAKPQLAVGGRTDPRRRARRRRRRRRGGSSSARRSRSRPTSSSSASSRPAAGRWPPLRAGLADVATDVVAVLAGDLPFLTAELVARPARAAHRRRRPGRRRRRPRPVPAGRLADGGTAGGRRRPRPGRRRCAACSHRSPSTAGGRTVRRASRRRGRTATPRPTSPGPARSPRAPAATGAGGAAGTGTAAGGPTGAGEPDPAVPGAPRPGVSGWSRGLIRAAVCRAGMRG